ncbi:dual specificity protein phosphatase 16 isoform X2 [Amphiprion ocellaris]|uniref:dual specificity protein phosphatase 16 isoform X2 n=1 Tax=Amphiprion ocellaris TaxID=80972 RepID=UPI0016499C56|nr:dual specificity protein phosphatase 16 isoform X2 [Amphiprion ocellaris]
MPRPGAVRPIGAEALVALLEGGLDRVVLIDSRPFVDFNSAHILEAVNVNCSKLMKRRLQQDKVQISELLQHSAKKKVCSVFGSSWSSKWTRRWSSTIRTLQTRLLSALSPSSASCWSNWREASLQFTCCQDLMQQNDIAYVLNASNTCPKPDFIPNSHFLRVPVNDSFCEKILPWLDRSVEFIEKAKASNARVLVHCLAGISRSATIAIAYIMKKMDMTLDEAYRFVKEKRPTISPNFNFLGQLLDFEKKIKSPIGPDSKLKPDGPGLPEEAAGCLEGPGGPGLALLEPLTLPCVLADAPEDRLLVRALSGLQLDENSTRLKRSFSLDIKSYGEPGGDSAHRVFAPHGGSMDDFYKPSAFKESGGKPCQFSPVEEVSEQSTPEQSPDKEEADGPQRATGFTKPPPNAQTSTASFLLGLSRSQQHLAKAGSGGALKGWHSDILLGPVTGGWYLSSESTCFYSAAFGCSHSLEAVQRRGRQRTGDRRDSRRSWHEESSFEKQLKRRSCQMEFGDGRTDSRSREDMGTVGSQSSFSGSMEVIEVS